MGKFRRPAVKFRADQKSKPVKKKEETPKKKEK
jgi:hypothetical protein